MTYLYKPLARKNFKREEMQYYPAPLPAAVTNFEQLAAEISAKCTLTRADAMGVLKELELQLLQTLLSGYTVRLGNLGAFRLTAMAECVDEAKDVGADLIKKVRVRYVPSVWINKKLLLHNIEFKNAYKANKNKKNNKALQS